jgi:hypothetical protein
MSSINPGLQEIHQIAEELRADPSKTVTAQDNRLVTVAHKSLNKEEIQQTFDALYSRLPFSDAPGPDGYDNNSVRADVITIAKNMLIQSETTHEGMHDEEARLFKHLLERNDMESSGKQNPYDPELTLTSLLSRTQEYPDVIFAAAGRSPADETFRVPYSPGTLTVKDLQNTVNSFDRMIKEMFRYSNEVDPEAVYGILSYAKRLLELPVVQENEELTQKLNDHIKMAQLGVGVKDEGIPKIILPNREMIEESQTLQVLLGEQHLETLSSGSIVSERGVFEKDPNLEQAILICSSMGGGRPFIDINGAKKLDENGNLVKATLSDVIDAARYLGNQPILDYCKSISKQTDEE